MWETWGLSGVGEWFRLVGRDVGVIPITSVFSFFPFLSFFPWSLSLMDLCDED